MTEVYIVKRFHLIDRELSEWIEGVYASFDGAVTGAITALVDDYAEYYPVTTFEPPQPVLDNHAPRRWEVARVRLSDEEVVGCDIEEWEIQGD